MTRRGITIRERFSYLDRKSMDAIERFYRHLNSRGYTPRSVTNNIYKIDRFLGGGNLNDLYKVDGNEIEQFIQRSRKGGLSGSTINAMLSGVNNLYEYLRDEGEAERNPVELRKHRVIVPNSLPRPMRDKDVKRFFKVIGSKRDRAIFMLMLRCGLRVGEVSRLKVEEVDVKRHTVRINRGKGGIDRVVYSSPDVERSIGEWMGTRDSRSEYLFPSAYGGDEPLSTRTIQRWMKRYLKGAGLDGKGCSPHNLRHTYATGLLNAGVGIRTLQELMGHREITMTMVYVKLYDETKREEYFGAMEKIQKKNRII